MVTYRKSSRNGRSRSKPAAKRNSPFELAKPDGKAEENQEVHRFESGFRCETDARGHATPRGRSPLEIVVDASEGFIPLWSKESTLRWRFRERSLLNFAHPAAVRTEVRRLLGEALLAWGDATPVKFAERSDLWDFEIVVRSTDDCDNTGCVLASAFFPDAGRHSLTIYPRMFGQERKEQVETLVHELGHVFGLRHFFAQLSESAWPSEVFGTHSAFSIMNYGSKSVLTPEDKADLKRLYRLVWRGDLTQINGTPIRLVRPYHDAGLVPQGMVALRQREPVYQPLPRAASLAEAM